MIAENEKVWSVSPKSDRIRIRRTRKCVVIEDWVDDGWRDIEISMGYDWFTPPKRTKSEIADELISFIDTRGSISSTVQGLVEEYKNANE